MATKEQNIQEIKKILDEKYSAVFISYLWQLLQLLEMGTENKADKLRKLKIEEKEMDLADRRQLRVEADCFSKSVIDAVIEGIEKSGPLRQAIRTISG